MQPQARSPIERLGLAIAMGTVLAAIVATQWPFHYQPTRFGIAQRWAVVDWSWFPRNGAGAVRLDRDFAQNLLMLVPLGLGFGLWRRAAPLRCMAEGLLLGIAVSVGLELAQLITPYRHTTLADVWRNGLGCMLGCVLAVFRHPKSGTV